MFEPVGMAHLAIERTSVEGTRRKNTPFGGNRNFSSPSKHAKDLKKDVDFAIGLAAHREPVFGIDPRLILVAETGVSATSVAEEVNWSRAGLRVLDTAITKQVIAFSDDPQMKLFLERLKAYSEGPKGKQKSSAYESFFDNILSVRSYGREDRLGSGLADLLDEPGPDITVDVDVWHPGYQELAESWLSTITTALGRVDGTVHDTYASSASGLALMRITASRIVLSQLLDVDLIAKISILPEPVSANKSISEIGAQDISGLTYAEPDAPIVGLIDSGVLDQHPLLKNCIVDATSVSQWITDGADRHGHGTAVASLLVRGPLDGQLLSNEWEAPPCRVLSVRVLDEHNEIPPFRLALTEIREAVEYLASHGVRIVNLSLGDPNGMLVGNRAPAISAMIDELARRHNLVFVVPTGTVRPNEYSPTFDKTFRSDYPKRMIESPNTDLIDPAPAALALTVAGVVPPLKNLPLGSVPVGQPGWPAPFSRIGFGVNGAIKPELSAPAGTIAQVQGSGSLEEHDALKIAVADGRPGAQGLITHDWGASLSAPLVSRVCAAVQDKYPSAKANLIRALVLQSIEQPDVDALAAFDLKESERETANLRLTGYGQASPVRSVLSSDRDTVLITQENIPIDEVHLYTVPIPDSFFVGKRADRGISVSLCYDPPVRARRIDYLASQMQFEVLRGVSAETVIDLFLAEDKELRAARKMGVAPPPSKLSTLNSRERILLRPSRNVRSNGANQLGRRVWKSSLSSFNEDSHEFVVAVQNVNRWDSPKSEQSYALAIRLWVNDQLPPIYAELRTKIETARLRSVARAQARS
ncbi:S8 family peptidase [Streptomyces sp. IBSNAI001]|uniref:S8 family peptidase n=1 Tax=Streptomyces sp. IBSNAI001 TaxID=3457499 RepID=UPI003FD43788